MKNSFSREMERIEFTSIPRASVWKLSRISPTLGVIRPADIFPGGAVIIDVFLPCKGFITDFYAPLFCPFPQFIKIRFRSVKAAQRDIEYIGADKQQIRSQFLHDIEFAFGPVKSTSAPGFRHALKITERLKQSDFHAEVMYNTLDICGAFVINEKSFSKISTPSKPAWAMASVFWMNSPLIETCWCGGRVFFIRRLIWQN